MGRQRRRVQGNLIWPRLRLVLKEQGWGSRERLAARLNLLGGQHPEFASLADIRPNSLSELRRYTVSDKLLFAIGDVLGVNIYWLAGLSDDRTPPAGVRRLLHEEDEPRA